MKKILATLAAANLAVAAFGQGTVNWQATGGAFIGQTNGTAYSGFESSGGAVNPLTEGNGSTMGSTAANNTALGYNGYYYELLVNSSATAPTTATALAGWSDTGLGATNSSASNGRIAQISPSTSATANNWAAGTSESVILVGWSANLGTSWSTVLNELQNWQTLGSSFVGANDAYFGVSAVGTLTSGTAIPGATIFGASAGQINNSSLNSPAGPDDQLNQLAVTIPEPTTMALAAIGGASLLLFRRKK